MVSTCEHSCYCKFGKDEVTESDYDEHVCLSSLGDLPLPPVDDVVKDVFEFAGN